ncbi:hypothetical protein CA11_33290 [Gimesia maris]|uniref:hypothetical protein n=1 Tax=Gimesia maris TaxID=122 RepID=UPI00118CFFDA|nr:hypothetical protein [Gimesia maris]QDU15504.1 hypothetical protein CA11_33290 [Gimesia maris]
MTKNRQVPVSEVQSAFMKAMVHFRESSDKLTQRFGAEAGLMVRQAIEETEQFIDEIPLMIDEHGNLKGERESGAENEST